MFPIVAVFVVVLCLRCFCFYENTLDTVACSMFKHLLSTNQTWRTADVRTKNRANLRSKLTLSADAYMQSAKREKG
jgi:hypothetical protein